MLIGITFDLKDDYLKQGFTPEETAEFDSPVTIDAIDKSLQAMGHRTERIGNIRSLVDALAKGKRWDMVFNICEGFYGMYSRESQVPALLEAYNIPCTFSDPLTIGITLKKDTTKILLQSFGIKTPEFRVIHSEAEIPSVNLPFPLFAKPLAEGTSKGISNKSKISSKEELTNVCRELLKKFHQPVLVETFCSGREFTVGVTGCGEKAEYLGALEVKFLAEADKSGYTYDNKQYYENRIEYELVNDVELNAGLKSTALKIWQVLQCRDCGRIDFIMDSNNEINFIELNPLAGINPELSDLAILIYKQGITYQELIGKIVNSAMERIGKRI